MTIADDHLSEAKRLYEIANLGPKDLEKASMHYLGSIACALIALCERLDRVIDGDIAVVGVFDTSRQPRLPR
jgi:hypothetical protein